MVFTLFRSNLFIINDKLIRTTIPIGSFARFHYHCVAFSLDQHVEVKFLHVLRVLRVLLLAIIIDIAVQ